MIIYAEISHYSSLFVFVLIYFELRLKLNHVNEDELREVKESKER